MERSDTCDARGPARLEVVLFAVFRQGSERGHRRASLPSGSAMWSLSAGVRPPRRFVAGPRPAVRASGRPRAVRGRTGPSARRSWRRGRLRPVVRRRVSSPGGRVRVGDLVRLRRALHRLAEQGALPNPGWPSAFGPRQAGRGGGRRGQRRVRRSRDHRRPVPAGRSRWLSGHCSPWGTRDRYSTCRSRVWRVCGVTCGCRPTAHCVQPTCRSMTRSSHTERAPSVCTAIAMSVSEFPFVLAEGLADRVHTRSGKPEVRFCWRAVPALLPVWWDGGVLLRLPATA